MPAEQYAINTGRHPEETTRDNVETFRRQLKSIGLSYDWDREFATCDVDYYRWTQWIFTRLYDRGLAYQNEVPVWWCDELKTVLANEEVIDGKSERGGFPCVRRPLRQWMLKITEYADRLIDDLDLVDWPESVKTMQREWIGRSEGAEIEFKVEGHANASLRVYTTRPDTLFGATFMVVAPEHPLVGAMTTEDQRAAVEAYVKSSSAKSDLERTDLAKEKTGVWTGAYAHNPAFDAGDDRGRIPIWVATTCWRATGPAPSWPSPARTSGTGTSPRSSASTSSGPWSRPRTSRARPSPAQALRSTRASSTGLGVDEAKARMISRLVEQGVGEGQDQLPAAGLALLAPALLGRAVPRLAPRGRDARARTRWGPAGHPAGDGRLQALRRRRGAPGRERPSG